MQGEADPLKYVIYRVEADTIGTATNPTSFKQAMTMPGARAYNLSQSACRTRYASMGVIRDYVNQESFTEQGTIAVRQACRTPWLSTQFAEADEPYLYGWAVWFPSVRSDGPNFPTFEVINVLNTRFVEANKI